MTPLYVPPPPAEVITRVARLIRDHPDRYNQRTWFSSAFLPGWYDRYGAAGMYPLQPRTSYVPVADLAQFGDQPVPDEPADPGRPLCGTTACVAGWAVILAGDPEISLQFDGGAFRAPGSFFPADIASYARQLMGLGEDQAEWLFDADRTTGQVLWALDALLADPGTNLEAHWPGDDDDDR